MFTRSPRAEPWEFGRQATRNGRDQVDEHERNGQSPAATAPEAGPRRNAVRHRSPRPSPLQDFEKPIRLCRCARWTYRERSGDSAPTPWPDRTVGVTAAWRYAGRSGHRSRGCRNYARSRPLPRIRGKGRRVANAAMTPKAAKRSLQVGWPAVSRRRWPRSPTPGAVGPVDGAARVHGMVELALYRQVMRARKRRASPLRVRPLTTRRHGSCRRA